MKTSISRISHTTSNLEIWNLIGYAYSPDPTRFTRRFLPFASHTHTHTHTHSHSPPHNLSHTLTHTYTCTRKHAQPWTQSASKCGVHDWYYSNTHDTNFQNTHQFSCFGSWCRESFWNELSKHTFLVTTDFTETHTILIPRNTNQLSKHIVCVERWCRVCFCNTSCRGESLCWVCFPKHCTPQHSATHCSTLQHTAALCNTNTHTVCVCFESSCRVCFWKHIVSYWEVVPCVFLNTLCIMRVRVVCVSQHTGCFESLCRVCLLHELRARVTTRTESSRHNTNWQLV